ncbi:MAG: TlpA disulfide reductase family protein [Parafilimonas sp.]
MLFCVNMPFGFSQLTDLKVGSPAPEINLPDPKGDTISLSEFKGKIVLIDFWATWCSPCVKEQPHLAQLYKKYNQCSFTSGTGFQIYGVSLDSKKTSWQTGIKKMKINWIQVSDLKFWASPVARLYNIRTLPHNVLVDGNGIIIAKNLHDKELEHTIRLLSRN